MKDEQKFWFPVIFSYIVKLYIIGYLLYKSFTCTDSGIRTCERDSNRLRI